MTYNFDVERWYELRCGQLTVRHERGELTESEYRRELAELERRYEEMLDRLDGSFQIPEPSDQD